MQKCLFSLPLVGIVLTACDATSPAPVVNANGSTFSASSMQPVSNTMPQAGWQTERQSLPTPSAMTPPTYPVPQPVYPPTSQSIATPQTKATAKPASQHFTIPRDAKNAPIYNQISKGFYEGDTYTVRKGDTLFLIAYIAGKDVKEIAALNHISEPYQLHIGQIIKIQPQAPASPSSTPQAIRPEVTYTPNGTTYSADGTMTHPINTGVHTLPHPNKMANTSMPSHPATLKPITWQWPTQGQIITPSYAFEHGNKSLEIAGNKGQPVKAAAAGKVVYAGNALEGYGNLIIIKHNDEFMSAYAHNDSIKVKEQDNVRAGQTIATLGSTGTNSNKLHFEIRHLGKPVDPMLYLPKR
ncbi:MAG: peptidoglycan DD-metalloendopeptidase family protein [Pasteurellaceae bacterium]|nr:peptidoglycan DD-metalloendopeptidase family protein [Pasteurellaceae bacterium]